MLYQPRLDAIVVEPVMTRQFCDLRPNFSLVHADRAVCFAAIAKVFLGYFAPRQGFNRLFRCWWRCIASLMLLHELRYDPVETFLRIDVIASNSIGWDAKSTEQLKDTVEPHRPSWHAAFVTRMLARRTCGHPEDDASSIVMMRMVVMMMMRVIVPRYGANVHEHLSHHALERFRLTLRRLGLTSISRAKI